MRGGAAFWVLFTIVVLVGVGAAAALFGAGADGSKNDGSSADGSSTTTTTQASVPVFHPYKVTAGVNIRAGPGTTYPVAGTVETGFEVFVVCVIDGETVNGPTGASNKWLRVGYNQLTGYIFSQYVAVGSAINDPAVIGVCKSV